MTGGVTKSLDWGSGIGYRSYLQLAEGRLESSCAIDEAYEAGGYLVSMCDRASDGVRECDVLGGIGGSRIDGDGSSRQFLGK